MNDFTPTHKTIIVGLFLTAIVVLTILGFDPTVLIGLFTMGLAGLGVTAMQAIKEQTNGTHRKMLDMLDKHADQLAMMQPLSEVAPREEQDAAGR